MAHRVIARLDIKGPNLVKGIHLEGLRVVGKPEAFAHHYYERNIDELLYVDVVASLYNRNSLAEIIRRTAADVFVPLTVAGGLRSLADIRNALLAGADKVALNTAAVRNPQIIREASRYFGSSTIVVAIEAIRQPDGRYFAYIDNGREHTGLEIRDWARRVEDLGAGEIILTSVDREGTGKGFDVAMTREVSSLVSIPVVAAGGAGQLSHLTEVVRDGHADAVSVASMLHYQVVRENTFQGDYSTEGNTEFLRSASLPARIQPATVADIKGAFRDAGLDVRFHGGC